MAMEYDLKKILMQQVRNRRESKKWTQKELALKTGVTKNTISDIEAGQNFASEKTLVSLALAFETQVYELLKPDDVDPDKAADILRKISNEVREAVEKIGNRYLGDGKG